MFRVLDDRPGSRAAVSVTRPGPLRVRAHVRASADVADLTGLRVLLIADLLARAAELSGLQVFTTWAFTGEPSGQRTIASAADASGIHPPVSPSAGLPEARLDSTPGVHVADDGAVDDDRGGILIRVATARLARDARPGDAGALGGLDPLAVRLALMSLPRHQPAELTAGELADATQTLSDWRHRVARWAESPSGAIPAPTMNRLVAAFGDQDIAAVLAVLRSLAADETVPPGRRFETFLYADRVLGLGLPRDIGR